VKIKLNSIIVQDQEKALCFYTDVLGFTKKYDFPAGKHRWLTVVSPEEPDGTQLVLEPDVNPAAATYQQALHKTGIPATAFEVGDIEAEYQRLLGLGVEFKSKPTNQVVVTVAVLDDTCGNLLQIYEVSGK
jgi:catechol 2,3-dioxygenase-like lactoylglutathione lyase family enzyme